MKDALKSPTLMAIARLYFAAHFGAVLGFLGLLASGDAEWSADRIRDPLFWTTSLVLGPSFVVLLACFRVATISLMALAVVGGFILHRVRPWLALLFVGLIMALVAYLAVNAWVVGKN